MEFFAVSLEAHPRGATLYVAGLLAARAALRAETLICTLPEAAPVLRVDLSGVVLIDPESFVQLARALARWRGARGGDVRLEFPLRSARSPRRPLPVDQRIITPTAVSAASSCPMSTSPG